MKQPPFHLTFLHHYCNNSFSHLGLKPANQNWLLYNLDLICSGFFLFTWNSLQSSWEERELRSLTTQVQILCPLVSPVPLGWLTECFSLLVYKVRIGITISQNCEDLMRECDRSAHNSVCHTMRSVKTLAQVSVWFLLLRLGHHPPLQSILHPLTF